MDLFNKFIQENYVAAIGNDILFSTMFDTYEMWIIKFNKKIKLSDVLKKKAFYRATRELNYLGCYEIHPKNVYYIRGLKRINDNFPKLTIDKQKISGGTSTILIPNDLQIPSQNISEICFPKLNFPPFVTVIENQTNPGNADKVIENPATIKKLTLNISRTSVKQSKFVSSASQSFEADSSASPDDNVSSKRSGKEVVMDLFRPSQSAEIPTSINLDNKELTNYSKCSGKEIATESSEDEIKNDSPFVYDEKGIMRPRPLRQSQTSSILNYESKPENPTKKEINTPKQINPPPKSVTIKSPPNPPKKYPPKLNQNLGENVTKK